MARNGSGTMSIPNPDFVGGTTILSSEVDANNADIVSELTNSIACDGQSVITANIPMATFKFTGLGAGSAATDSATLGQVQAQAYVWCGTAGGTADAITLSPSPAITAYAAGQTFRWKAGTSANTGAMTIAISGLTTIAAQSNLAALAAGGHEANAIYEGTLDTTSTMQIRKVSLAAAASATASGIVELATTAETTTGTDTSRAITPAGLHAGLKGLTDTAIAAGDQIYFADANDSNNLKSGTVQGILDLAGGTDRQSFTSSDTWTKPSSGTVALIECWGGGASGGKGTAVGGAGGGGGGGYSYRWILMSSLGATETVTIGAGGAAQTTADTDGNAGGNTTFGAHLTAYGGGAGGRDNANLNNSGGGGGGQTSAGSTGASTGGDGGGPVPGAGGANATNADHGVSSGGGGGRNGGLGGNGFYGGGGGGAGHGGAGLDGLAGGVGHFGGGGGGGGSATGNGGGAGGASTFAGAGGAGATGATAATAGTQPSGGGGGSETGDSGAGAGGQCTVTVF